MKYEQYVYNRESCIFMVEQEIYKSMNNKTSV